MYKSIPMYKIIILSIGTNLTNLSIYILCSMRVVCNKDHKDYMPW